MVSFLLNMSDRVPSVLLSPRAASRHGSCCEEAERQSLSREAESGGSRSRVLGLRVPFSEAESVNPRLEKEGGHCHSLSADSLWRCAKTLSPSLLVKWKLAVMNLHTAPERHQRCTGTQGEDGEPGSGVVRLRGHSSHSSAYPTPHPTVWKRLFKKQNSFGRNNIT